MKPAVTLVEPGTVRLERLLPGPLERVWAYITESDKRAKWLAAGQFDLRLGGRIRLEFDNSSLSSEKTAPEKYRERQISKGHVSEGVITRLQPMHALAHTWIWNGAETEVTYELTPKGRDVLLVIVHRRLQGRELQASVMGGWDVHTGILDDVLRGLEPRPFWSTHARLEREYGAAL